MEKWKLFNPANALRELPISMLTCLTKDMHDPANQVRNYMRVCDLYDADYRVKACEEVLEINGPQRIAVISGQDVEFLVRNQDAEYGWVELSLADPEFLAQLTELLALITDRPYTYQIWTDDQRATLVRQPNPDFEPVPEQIAIPQPSGWNICHITGQPHRFVEGQSPQIPIIGNPYGATCWRLCRDCHLPVYTSKL